ncbi:MAG: SOS response-associated peptidase family protein [Bacteroidetes bacterium]|jgi:putative SOS response-associated peptidase YedK|nr:SOS response-associated peptidase family protein [Bacteroidota bacterium]
MCYVIGVKIPKKETIKIGSTVLDLDAIDIPVQSGFAYQNWPVIYKESSSFLRPGLMHWELIPNWARNEKELTESRKKYTTLNIKGETVLTNKVAAFSVHTNRCLVLASHFFEWQEVNKEKYPHCISVKETPLFYIAGVWNTWTNHQTGELKNSFGIITTEANGLMSKIHNVKKRMPTILNDELAKCWVNENLDEKQILEIATHSFDENKMSAYTVAKNFQQTNTPCEKVDYKIFTPQSLF